MANVEDRTIDDIADYALDLQEKLDKKSKECEYYLEEVARLEEQLKKTPDSVEVNQALVKQLEQLQKASEEQDKLVAEMQKQLKAAMNYQESQYAYGSFKAYKRLLQVREKETAVYKAKLRAATAETASVKKQAELDLKKAQDALEEEKRQAAQDLKDVLSTLDIGDILLSSIILPEFQSHYPDKVFTEGTNVKNVKFDEVCRTAESKDKKYNDEMKKYEKRSAKKPNAEKPTLSDDAYSLIFASCVQKVDEYLTALRKLPGGEEKYQEVCKRYGKSQGVTAEELTQIIIKENRNRSIKDIAKSKPGIAVISSVGALILIGAVLATVFGVHNANLTADNAKLAELAELGSDQGKAIVARVGDVNGEVTLANSAKAKVDLVQQFSDIGMGGRSVGFNSQEFNRGYNQVMDAQKSMDEIVTLDASGNIDQDSPAGVVIASLNKSIADKNVESAQQFSDQLATMSENAAQYATDAQGGSKTLVEALGDMFQRYDYLENLMNQPTVTVNFSAADLVQYKNDLKNQSAQGKVTSVESCVYYKDTGLVEILVKGITSQRQDYYNFISFKADAGMVDPSVKDIMDALKATTDVKTQAFDQTLESMSGSTVQMTNKEKQSVTGSAAVTYSMDLTYNEKSNTTTCKVSALIYVNGGEEGKATDVVTFTLDMQGYHSKKDFKEMVENKIASQFSNLVVEEAERQ